MASLIDIRRRLKSVKNTQQITRAMKLVAAAKLRRSQDRVIAARPYSKALRDVLTSVAARVPAAAHPLLEVREEKRVVVLVVAGDKGLCGAFNANVHRAVAALLAERAGWQSVTLLPIGKKALDYWKRRRWVLAPKAYPGIFSRVELAHAREIAEYLTGEIVARRNERARARSANSLIAQIGEIAHGLAADAGLKWRHVTFATVGSPGVFEPDEGYVMLAPNLPGWGRHGLVEAVRRELGTNVAFENDVNLATLGEQWRGLGKEVPSFVYLHVGTGVGMGIVVNGELYRGSRGAAGEIGYLPLAAADPHDPTNRRRGALEGAIGAAGIVRTARQLGVSPPLTPKKVFSAARRGDPRARRVVELVAERIALAVAAVAPVLDPELVVLGGGVGQNGDLLLPLIERELGALSPFEPRVEVSALGEDAVLQGAVSLALEEAQELLFRRARTRQAAT